MELGVSFYCHDGDRGSRFPLLGQGLVGLGLCAIFGVVGCQAIFVDKPPIDYRTVQASPHRDTAKAEKLHEKAIGILSSCANGCPCQCIAQTLCNPCKAERHLQDALIADVRYGPAHNTLGTIYLRQRKLYLAAWEFEYATGLMPEQGEPLNNLGLVYEEAGRLGQAIEQYERALACEPTNPNYLGNLARASLKQGAPVTEVQYLLRELLLYDSRPEWIAWAEELLHTQTVCSATPLGSIDKINTSAVPAVQDGRQEAIIDEINSSSEVLLGPSLLVPAAPAATLPTPLPEQAPEAHDQVR